MKILDSTRYRDEFVEAAHHYADIRPVLALRFITALDQARARAIAKPLAFRDRGQGVRAVLLRHFPYRLRFRLRVCLGKKPGQRERERVLGQGDRGGGGPAAHAARGQRRPSALSRSLVERQRWADFLTRHTLAKTPASCSFSPSRTPQGNRNKSHETAPPFRYVPGSQSLSQVLGLFLRLPKGTRLSHPLRLRSGATRCACDHLRLSAPSGFLGHPPSTQVSAFRFQVSPTKSQVECDALRT